MIVLALPPRFGASLLADLVFSLPVTPTPETPPEDDDRAFIDALARRDPKAVQGLVERFDGYILAIALSVTGDAGGAEDVRQETLLRILTKIRTLEDPQRLASWIGHIARRAAIDWRRRRRRPVRSLDQTIDDQSAAEPADPGAELPLDRLSRLEMRTLVLESIAELPDHYRQVLSLKHIAGMSYAEISAELGLTVPTIESRLYRARLELKARLEARLDFDPQSPTS